MYAKIMSALVAIIAIPLLSYSQLSNLTWNITEFEYQTKQTKKLKVVDSSLYVLTNIGVWKKGDTGDWIQCNNIGHPSDILKKEGIYYLCTHNGHLYLGTDICSLEEFFIGSDMMFYEITQTSNGKILAASNKGIYSINDQVAEILNMPNKNVHNNEIFRIIELAGHLLAFGCDFIYQSSDEGETWETIGFQHNYCISDVFRKGNVVYFSTSGEGLYLYNANSGNVVNLPFNNQHRNVQKLEDVGNQLIRIENELIYEGGPSPFVVVNDYITDLVKFKEYYYISSLENGIYSTEPQIQLRNKVKRGLNVYPNPSDSEVTVCMEGDINTSGVIRVYNTLGTMIATHKYKNDRSDNCIRLTFTAAGEYLVTLDDQYGQLIKRFTIVK